MIQGFEGVSQLRNSAAAALQSAGGWILAISSYPLFFVISVGKALEWVSA
jgi:hypothetical protein